MKWPIAQIKKKGPFRPAKFGDSDKVRVGDWVLAVGNPLAPDGRFYAVVRLRKEGMNELRIRAQDTAGNETQLTRVAYVEMF